MVDKKIEFGSKEYREIRNQVYNEPLLKCVDITERNDFYGLVAWRGIPFLGEKLGLTSDSHLLELCSGIGGPARFFDKTYGGVSGLFFRREINPFWLHCAKIGWEPLG